MQDTSGNFVILRLTNYPNLPGNSHCMLLGLPCEHGISVPQQSGWRHRGCRHFSVDSALPRRYHCEIPSGRASGLSAFLEYYKREQLCQHAFSHQPLLSLVPPHSFSTCVGSADRSTLQECDLCDSVSLLSTIPLLSFSLIFSFPHPLRVSFSFLRVLLFLDLCFCVCPSVCVWSMSVDQWASDSGLCPLNTCTSLSAKLSLDVYPYVCIYGTLSPLWPPSWVSDSFSSSVPLWGGGASSEHDHHHALI